MDEDAQTLLHVGCGAFSPVKLPAAFRAPYWREIRLDIDPGVAPDIVASITDMAPLQDGVMDAVFSAHNLEHLYPHEVPLALREFRRVLKPTGFALITLPDLHSIAERIAAGGLTDPAYVSTMGPITPLDMLYGFGPALRDGNHFMAHRTGFTGVSLMRGLAEAGFGYSVVQRHPTAYSLWAIGFSAVPTPDALAAAQEKLLPLHRMAAANRALAA
jgi:SAM-dependent methyltransferase